jgi:hypothetical protein
LQPIEPRAEFRGEVSVVFQDQPGIMRAVRDAAQHAQVALEAAAGPDGRELAGSAGRIAGNQLTSGASSSRPIRPSSASISRRRSVR